MIIKNGSIVVFSISLSRNCCSFFLEYRINFGKKFSQREKYLGNQYSWTCTMLDMNTIVLRETYAICVENWDINVKDSLTRSFLPEVMKLCFCGRQLEIISQEITTSCVIFFLLIYDLYAMLQEKVEKVIAFRQLSKIN